MAQKKCPECGRSVVWESPPRGPFCSDRCRMSDFGAWLGEEYAVPGDPVPHDAQDEENS